MTARPMSTSGHRPAGSSRDRCEGISRAGVMRGRTPTSNAYERSGEAPDERHGRMPDRIIRERALTSPSLDRLSDGAERLWWRLVPVADDYGRFDANPMVVRAKCFPLRTEKRLRVSIVEIWLRELVSVDGIRLYSVLERQFGYFPAWFESQRRRESKAKFPDPPENVPAEEARELILHNGEQVSALAASCGEPPPIPKAVRPRAEGREPRGGQNARVEPLAAPDREWNIPESITKALARCPFLGAGRDVQSPIYWRAAIRAHPAVDFPRELLKAEEWCTANRERAPKKRLAAFLSRWFSRADDGGT